MKDSYPGYLCLTRTHGFSLVEILLVTGLIGVLLSLALPQYKAYLERGQRVDAIRMLTTAAGCLERHRAGSGVYDTTRCLPAAEQEAYRLTIEPAATLASDTYILTAEPVDSAENERCGSLSLNQAGTRSITGPGQNLYTCWSGR